jgi:hypothetical protein
MLQEKILTHAEIVDEALKMAGSSKLLYRLPAFSFPLYFNLALDTVNKEGKRSILKQVL